MSCERDIGLSWLYYSVADINTWAPGGIGKRGTCQVVLRWKKVNMSEKAIIHTDV